MDAGYLRISVSAYTKPSMPLCRLIYVTVLPTVKRGKAVVCHKNLGVSSHILFPLLPTGKIH